MGFWNTVADFAGTMANDAPKTRIEPTFDQTKDANNPADDKWWDNLGGGGPTNSGVDVNTESALRHAACMACVAGLAEDLAKIPFNVYIERPNGGHEVAHEHPLNKLLRKPNDWQTGFEFRELLQASLVLRGNAYAVTVRDGRGEPKYLVPIHPDRVGLFESPDGSYFYAVTRNGLHEWAMLRDQPVLVSSYNMLHLRWLSSWNSLLGTSRLSLARESLGVAIGLEKHQARFVGQGARVGGVLSTEQKFANKEVREQLRSEFQKLHGGATNSGAIAVLEQGLKWEPLGLTMVDSQFIESRNFSVRDIARCFNFPPYRLALEGENEGPAMVQQQQQYLNGPISGYCERWKAKFEQFFDLDGRELSVGFDYSHFIKADQVSRYTAYRQSTGAAWQTINEARRVEGLPDVEGGDKVLQPVNMQPLGWKPPETPTAGPGSDTTGKPGEGGDGDALRDEAGDDPPKD